MYKFVCLWFVVCSAGYVACQTYNETSQVWALSFLSGIANGHSANSTELLLDYTVTAMSDLLNSTYTQSLIGEWELVWGPVIYSRTFNIADNTAVILKNKNSPTWVLSLAGTDPRSLLDWLEDLRVRITIPWHRIVRSAPRSSGSIALGTHKGLEKIVNMKDASNRTIIEFLRDVTFVESTLYVTGHSLGGALTSVTGLYLLDNESSWKSPQDNITIKFRPSAGPTPGDAKWNDYFFSRIGSDASIFLSEINTIDIVPQAWDAETLAQIPYFYNSCIPFNNIVNETVYLTIDWANNQYQQMPYQSYIAGEFVLTGNIVCNRTSDILNLDYFFQEVGYQHMNAYYEPLGICNFMQAYNCVSDYVYPGKQVPTISCTSNISCGILDF